MPLRPSQLPSRTEQQLKRLLTWTVLARSISAYRCMLTLGKNFIADKNASGVVVLLKLVQDPVESCKLRLGPGRVVLHNSFSTTSCSAI